MSFAGRRWANPSTVTAYTYNSWCHMRVRCFDENSDKFKDYGARGITVCDRWRDDYDAFVEDMGLRPKGMTLERVNNDRNYEPGNCRWATRWEQGQNKVRKIGDSVMYSVDDMCKAGCATRRAIRFWEDEGLLGTVERTEGNQRRYTAEQLDKARVIAAAQFGGWQLSDIKEMVGGYDGEAREAILHRLTMQAEAAARLAEMLPAVEPMPAFDL